ncbi:MAG: hypothetical protein H6R27_1011 [Proteobacteria bacterium]|nr:hypothetical protein [Pseudomonadota bacterium]
MNTEDIEAMQALDNRLRKMFAGLDAAPGFEERLRARIATLAAQPPAEIRDRLEREHDRARAAAARAARLDGLAVAIAGVGGLLAVWRFAPDLARFYEASVETAGPSVVAFGTLGVAAVALWAVLRRFDVDPRTLIGA